MSSKRAKTERDERLALVIEGTTDGIWDWNLKTNEVYFSQRWKAQLGYEDRELTNCFEEWERLIHPDDLERAHSIAVLLEWAEPDVSIGAPPAA
jgi:PAS domain S-box-containing protein